METVGELVGFGDGGAAVLNPGTGWVVVLLELVGRR
jgi:hypothetical protein